MLKAESLSSFDLRGKYLIFHLKYNFSCLTTIFSIVWLIYSYTSNIILFGTCLMTLLKKVSDHILSSGTYFSHSIWYFVDMAILLHMLWFIYFDCYIIYRYIPWCKYVAIYLAIILSMDILIVSMVVLLCFHEYTSGYIFTNFSWEHAYAWTCYENIQFYKIMPSCFLVWLYKLRFPLATHKCLVDPYSLHSLALMDSSFCPQMSVNWCHILSLVCTSLMT